MASFKTELRWYTILGNELHVEDRAGHRGAAIVAGELNNGAYGLADLGLKPGAVVVDVGAHVGLVSMMVARLYPGVEVHAVEPHPDNHACLVRNLDRNAAAGVIPTRLGVSASGGERPLVMPPDATVGASSWLRDANEAGAELASVPTVTVPRLFEVLGVGRCDWLKVDAEGAEHGALRACPPSFFGRVGRLTLELHGGPRLLAYGYTPRRLRAYLDSTGVDYDVAGVVQGGEL